MIDPRRIPSIDPATAHDLTQARSDDAAPAVLVDVREPDEYARLRAPGAVLLPLSRFVAEHDALPRDRPLLMICASGNRSLQATAYLLSRGWPDVRNVTGGMLGWQRAGLEVRAGALDPGEGELPR